MKKNEGRVMQDHIASHIVAITSRVFGISYDKHFNQLGQMSELIKELDKEFVIQYKEE